MKITAVIPTKNRLDDLMHAVDSIKRQSQLPDELVIIDQSDQANSMQAIQSSWSEAIECRLIYVHDPTITGLVDAKRVAVEKSSGDVICFLEDDVVLDSDYVKNMKIFFEKDPHIMGGCGVVTYGAPASSLYLAFFHFFHRGIFKDRRVGIHGNAASFDQEPIASNFLSGGVSAYRKEVFDVIKFDVANGFFALEDIDFSTRAVRHFGWGRFFINPASKLEHHMSPANRDQLKQRYRRKFKEFILFYKKNKFESYAFGALCWLLMGLYLEAFLSSLSHFKLTPLTGAVQGMFDGIHWKIIP